ncbi:MAG: cation diffusion facilitator family transporter [Fibrobacterales bacterium]
MNRQQYGILASLVSIIVNLLLFGLKYWAAVVSGSVALMADAWHTLSDSLSSVILFVGMKISGKEPDEDHPFGHARSELIVSILIGALLAAVAFEFLIEAYHKFTSKEGAAFGTVAIVVTIISIVLKEGMAQFSFYIGKKSENDAVKADGWHHRTDALSSVIVLAGIFLKDYFWWIDSALAIIIAIMLFYAAYEIITETSSKLLGQAPTQKMLDTIHAIGDTIYPLKLHPHHFHYHDYISHKELTFHISMKENLTVKESHDVADQYEKEIKRRLNIYATIHIDPISVVSHKNLDL